HAPTLIHVIPWICIFFFSSRRRHTRFSRDWSSDVCSSDLIAQDRTAGAEDDMERDSDTGRSRMAGADADAQGRPTTERPAGEERSEERRGGEERRSRGEQDD